MKTDFPDLNELLMVMFNTAGEGLLVCDQQGVIRLVNPRILSMFGYQSHELLGQKIEILIPESARQAHVGHREGYVQNPKQRHMGIGMQLRARHRDGHEFPIEAGLNHFEKNGDRFVIALISDITMRAAAENELKRVNLHLEELVKERTRELTESQLLYSTIARNFPKGTINVFDRNLSYIFVEGEDLYRAGITGDKLVGTGYIERLPERIAPVIQKNLLEVFKGKKMSFEVNIPKGSYLLNCVPLPSENGRIERILVVEQNISAIKEAEDRAMQALNKERELSELKSKFVSLASHEFRTPLSTILSSAVLISRYNELGQTEKMESHAGRIKDNVKALTAILNDFLSLGKLEEGHVRPEPRDIEVPSFFEKIAEEMREIARPGQTIDFMHRGRSTFQTDPQILRNITINLLTNAIKYSPDESPITLTCQSNESQLAFQVTDHGMGIPEQEQGKLFERFFRARNAANIQGTGLGLNIVKRYVEILEGQITFESQLGRGSTFSVTIPQTKNDEQENPVD